MFNFSLQSVGQYIFSVGMKVVSSLKSLKKRDINCKVVRRRGKLYVINKKNPKFKARQGQFMDIDPQKKTWSNFMKLTTYACVAIVVVLALMAIFLL